MLHFIVFGVIYTLQLSAYPEYSDKQLGTSELILTIFYRNPQCSVVESVLLTVFGIEPPTMWLKNWTLPMWPKWEAIVQRL